MVADHNSQARERFQRLFDIRLKRIGKFVIALEKLAKEADALELLLPNGGEVGSILGGCVTDIESQYKVR